MSLLIVRLPLVRILFSHLILFLVFFFNDTAPTEIYTLSLHDALPIYVAQVRNEGDRVGIDRRGAGVDVGATTINAKDRKSTRLNSSHANISYAVFCLKKKKK